MSNPIRDRETAERDRRTQEVAERLIEFVRFALEDSQDATQTAEVMVMALLPDADAIGVIFAGLPGDVREALPDGTLAALGRLLPDDLWRDARAVAGDC